MGDCLLKHSGSGGSSLSFVSADNYVLMGDKSTTGGAGGYEGVTKTSANIFYFITNPVVKYSMSCQNNNSGSIPTAMSIRAWNSVTGDSKSVAIWSGSVPGGCSTVTKNGTYTFTGTYDKISATVQYYEGGSNGYYVSYLYCDEGTVVLPSEKK